MAFVCPPEHAHGATSTCYHKHGCRDQACRDALAARGRARRRALAYGTYEPQQPAGPIREHLLTLHVDHGMAYRTIAELAEVSTTVIADVVWGRRDPDGNAIRAKRIAPGTARRILALQPTLDHTPGHATVPSRGSLRRLQALQRMGWTCYAIGRHIGIPGRRLSSVREGHRVLAATARAIAAAYEQLWDQTPPAATPTERAMSTRAQQHAIANRWPAPLDWDDIDLDPSPADGEHVPYKDALDPVAIEQALTTGATGRLTPAERRICIPELHARQWSDKAIATQLLCSEKTIGRIRDELGLPAWADNEQLVTRAALAA